MRNKAFVVGLLTAAFTISHPGAAGSLYAQAKETASGKQSTNSAAAGQSKEAGTAAKPKEPASGEFPTPEFEKLDLLVGPWQVEQKHFAPSGSVLATADGTEEVTWLLDRHAVQRVYRTKAGTTAYEAIGLLTWSQASKRFEGMWFDNASTGGPTQLTGEWRDEDRTFMFELDGPDGHGGRTKYKTVERFESDKVRRATTYAVNGGEIVKINEVTYTRTAPCPDRIRPIMDK